MPPTIIVPTQQQLYDSQHNPNSLLAMYNAANTPAPVAGSPGAVTAAGTPSVPGSAGSNLNNLNNPDWITSMTEMMNQINLKAQQEANAARIPGAAGLEQTSSGNIKNELAGQVPNDVFRELQQRGAEQGVFTGSPAGASTTAGIMQALGLTSLDMTNLGQKHLTEAYGRNPGAPLSNPQALVTTPAQAEALRLQQQNMELDYLARMAAINAANNRTRSGYGGGGGGYPKSGGGGGGFAPTTNWQGGAPNPIAGPWHDPGQGGISDSDWNQMLYGYGDNGDYISNPGTPPNTIYNPNTDTSDYMPYGQNLYGDIFGSGNGGGGEDISDSDWYEMLYGAGG